MAVVIVSASAYGENAIFKESMDFVSAEAVVSAALSADAAAVVSSLEAAAASVLEEEHPVVSPRQSARERAGTTNFLIIIPP